MLASLLWLEELQYENESYLALFEVHSLVSGMKSFNLLQIVSRFLREISLDLGDVEDVHSYQRDIQGMIRLPWGQGFVLALVLTLSTIGYVTKYIFFLLCPVQFVFVCTLEDVMIQYIWEKWLDKHMEIFLFLYKY